MKTLIIKNFKETQQLAGSLASKIEKGAIFALEGDLGSGKTTFTQGLLKGLKLKGPYTSPTFVIMKQYNRKTQNPKPKTQNIYHIDAYRIKAQDILNLGWKELVAEKNNIIIIEWADRIKKIIPHGAMWIKFEWLSEKERKIIFK